MVTTDAPGPRRATKPSGSGATAAPAAAAALAGGGTASQAPASEDQNGKLSSSCCLSAYRLVASYDAVSFVARLECGARSRTRPRSIGACRDRLRCVGTSKALNSFVFV